MKDSRRASAILAGLLIASPLIILLIEFMTTTSRLTLQTGIDRDEVLQVFATTFVQAVLSAGVAVALGSLAALGFLRASRTMSRAGVMSIELASLLPNAAPVLVFLLAVLKFAPGLRGVAGVVAVHAALNTGLVAVSLAAIAREKIGSLSELAWIEGASQSLFLRRVAWPLMGGDLVRAFIFVFVLCFASFSVPLMIGGSQATTVEVLIWQKVRLSEDWTAALQISILQMLAILVFSYFLSRQSPATPPSRQFRSPLLGWWGGVAVALVPTAILIVGLLDSAVKGFTELYALGPLRDQLPVLLLGSFSIAIAVGCGVSALLLLLAFADLQGRSRKLLLGYTAPSAVLTAFAFLIVWHSYGVASYIKIIFALIVVSLPAFYRLRWDSALNELSMQRTTARTLGASEWLIFRRILLPQLLRPLGFIAGAAAVWAWGDFALSGIIAERTLTISMAVRALLDSYRFDIATAMIWILIFGAVTTFILFAGVARVLGPKSQT